MDIKLIHVNNSIHTNWSQKTTFSAKILNFNSINPIHHKIAMVFSLFDKAIKLSHIQYHQHNINLVRAILHLNDYPSNFINKYIKMRLFTLKHPPDLVNQNQIRSRRYAYTTKIRVPYKKQLYNNINKVLKNQNIIDVPYIKNNLSCVIRKGKDKIEKEDNVHNIYQLKCNNCQYTYVGQCKRALKIRLKEHLDSINDCTDKVVALHCNDNKHKVN